MGQLQSTTTTPSPTQKTKNKKQKNSDSNKVNQRFVSVVQTQWARAHSHRKGTILTVIDPTKHNTFLPAALVIIYHNSLYLSTPPPLPTPLSHTHLIPTDQV